jgi:predicted negative regulator of RcsB-dependent stress response
MEMTRQDIRKDGLTDVVIFSIEWIKKNQATFLSVAGIVTGLIVFAVFFIYRMQTLKTSAADRLSMAQGMLYQGQKDQAFGVFDEIITGYGKTGIAVQAALIKADYLMGQKNYAEAEKTLLPLTARTTPKEMIPLAYIVLGAAQENSGKYDEAIKTYNDYLAKYSAHFVTPKVYESLSRIYEIKGDYQNAAVNYERIVALYPNSPWSQRAQERAGVLSSAKEKQSSQPQPVK